jgi:TonB-dependent starch-binding outer membrane protein SusC
MLLIKPVIVLVLLLVSSAIAFGQTVSGVVLDAETGEPLPSANIVYAGTTIGTATNLEGEYSLEVPSLDGTLVFRYVGYETREVPIAGNTVINVSLESETLLADELVVVAYGVQQRSLVTGAISRIEARDIQQSASLRVEQALQGRTPGVIVMQNSGQPGSGVTVRIRGIGTTGDAEPLYIVDGMPVSGIDYLSPNDIASVEVLKDAAATAIYGARGANGVVMISTVGGQAGPIQVSYNGYVGVQNPWRHTSLLAAPQYMMIMNESFANDGRAIPFPDIDERVAAIGQGTDWQDAVFFYNAPVMNHSLRLSGGSETSRFMTSLSYRQQDGIVAQGKSNYERLTLRLDTDHTRGQLSYGSRITYANRATRGIDPNEEFGGIMARVANIDPVTPVRNEDGSFGTSPYASQEVVNPVAAIDIVNSQWREDKFVGGVFGNYSFNNTLSLRSSIDLDLAYGGFRSFLPTYKPRRQRG